MVRQRQENDAVMDFLVPEGMGAARKRLRMLEADEGLLLAQMQQQVSSWQSLFQKIRFVDLVLQRQGVNKLLWRLRMKVSGSQGFVDLMASEHLEQLPSTVVVTVMQFEQPRLLLNARMKSVRSTRLAIEAYLESMRQLRQVEETLKPARFL